MNKYLQVKMNYRDEIRSVRGRRTSQSATSLSCHVAKRSREFFSCRKREVLNGWGQETLKRSTHLMQRHLRIMQFQNQADPFLQQRHENLVQNLLCSHVTVIFIIHIKQEQGKLIYDVLWSGLGQSTSHFHQNLDGFGFRANSDLRLELLELYI